MLVIAIRLVVPVVRGLIEQRLLVLLLAARKVAVLPQELALQSVCTRDALGGVEDQASILLGCPKLVLQALLIQGSVTCQVRLLSLHIAVQGVLGELLLVLVVLAVEARRHLAEVLGESVLRLLHGVVVGASAERTIRSELSRQSRSRVLVVAVDDVLLGLVDHLP